MFLILNIGRQLNFTSVLFDIDIGFYTTTQPTNIISSSWAELGLSLGDTFRL